VGGPGGHELPSLHQQLLIKIKSGHPWLDTLVPDPDDGATVSHLWIHVPSVAKTRAGQMPSVMPWPSETFSRDLPPPTPGHPPPSDRVAAQSLVTLGNQRCLLCASLPLAGTTCHPPNTELKVSTNQENKWKKRRKKKANNSDITQQEFSTTIGLHAKKC